MAGDKEQRCALWLAVFTKSIVADVHSNWGSFRYPVPRGWLTVT